MMAAPMIRGSSFGHQGRPRHGGRWDGDLSDRDREPGQDVRQGPGARRHRHGCSRRHGIRPARSERRRQDDRDPGALDPAATRLGPSRGRGLRRGARAREGPKRDRAHRSVRGRRRAALGPGEPVHDRTAAGHARVGGDRPGQGAARVLRPHRGRDEVRQDVLRRDAAPARPGREPRRASAVPLPRRADDRPGPAEPGRALGHDPRPRRPRERPCCSRPSTSRRPTGWPTRSS